MYEPIGFYTQDGDPICADCHDGNPDDAAVFPDSETDYPSHCRKCETLIPEALTADGVRYVAYALTAPTGRECILAQWWEAYGDLVVDAYRDALAERFSKAPAQDAYSPA